MTPTTITGTRFRTTLLGCTAAATAAVCGAAAPATAQPATANTARLEEIVVTAQKREQSLQDVPISITAVTQETLQANRITSVLDLGALVPNVTIRTTRGASGLPQITVRGIVNRSGSSVPMYLDGVLIGGVRGVAFDLPDIERIELLRGPQGTLFGRNSTGGALSIVTRDPSGEFRVRQALTVGNYQQFRSSTRVETPRFGPFSASISYTHDEREGDIKNVGAGTVWNKTAVGLGRMVSPKTLGDKNSESVFVAVKFEPSDNFNVVYKYDWTENDFTPEGYGYFGFLPSVRSPVTGPLIQAMYNANRPPGPDYHRPKYLNNAYTAPGHSKASGHSITANLRINDELSLKNILAYRQSSIYAASDISGLGGMINLFPSLGVVGAPMVVTGVESAGRNKQWSDELLLNYDSKRLTLTLGAQYIDIDQFFGPPDGLNNLSFSVVPNFTLLATSRAFTNETQKSWAVFGQAEVHVTPQLDLVSGYRYTKDKKFGTPFVGNRPIPYDYEASKSTYSFGANYRPAENIMIYAKYGTGYVAGGASADVAFGPETVKSWEVGVKSDLLDSRLRVNLVGWKAKYEHLQLGTLGVNIGRPDIQGVTVDQGDELAKGGELEVTALPIRGLSLTGGLGYTDAHLTRLNPVFGNLSIFKLTQIATWTANLAGQYQTEPLFGEARLTFRADAQWHSKLRVIGQLPVNPAFKHVEYVEPSWLVNARASLQGISLPRGEVEVALWVKNLFDNDLPQFPIASGNPAYLSSGNYERARTFGLDLIYDF